MSIECAASRRRSRRRGSARSSRRRCRSPAPARPASARRCRTAPSNASAASSSPVSTSGSTPSRASTPSAKTSPFAASRVAEVAQNRIRGRRRARAISAAYSSIAANVRSSASSASRPVRSTPWPSRTIRDLAHRDVGQVADQQLDRVGAAVDRGDQRSLRAPQDVDAGPGRPPVAEQVEHLVAERVHAAALRRATGRPARAGTSPGRACRRRRCPRSRARRARASRPGGEVALVGGAVGRRQLGVLAEPVLHLLHQARSPRACRSARPRAGR